MTIATIPIRKYRDPLRRFTPTPLTADLWIMGRNVRLETNSQTVSAAMTGLFAHDSAGCVHRPDFHWRIVGEAAQNSIPVWPEIAAFSEEGLRYVTFGQRSFFAVDLNKREAIAFLPEEWAGDSVGFASVFTATLFDMTASALRLVQLGAACVALQDRALLIFGPARSGKTTATYLAGKLGLGFHSDQASFIDLQADGLRVWGQFWPAAFRLETLWFLPELAAARTFLYGGEPFLCLDEHPFQASRTNSVTPVGCVFLERAPGTPLKLSALTPSERHDHLRDAFAFQDDARFQDQYETALRMLGCLPAYRLTYGPDPAVAARCFGNILMNSGSLGVAS